ncbi:MAG TPA: ABC transporter ATP-binding protein [Chloroflexi bacterium]|nr:ABC transporter ATP-binding protein [Chloroflexota bacterium]
MLEVRDIHKTYEGQPLLRGVSLKVDEGETVCLLGRSGSGKSTLLRIITGLEQPESGDVLWDGASLRGVPVHERNFGLMFQDFALFPHRSVFDNVAFGLRMKHASRAEVEERVMEVLRQVDMQDFARRRVTDLSGGEQQRVALARALAPRPRLLLLDEPLGALDKTLREQLVEELRHLLHVSGTPAVYVTHDQEEAFAVADRLVLLNQGRVEQRGTPAEIYNSPDTPWVARFLGLTNLVPGEVVSSQPLQVRTDLGLFQPACPPGAEPAPGSKVTLLFKPSGASVAPAPQPVNGLEGVVEDVVFRGEAFRVTLALDHDYRFSFNLEQRPTQGQPVSLALEDGAVLCLG